MKTFSIAEIEQYTLIKPHTIRVWERRFGFLKAGRNATNTRFYTLEELAFLLNFGLLNRYGAKVSKIACLDKELIVRGDLELKEETAKQEQQINRLIISMFSLNVEDFELVLESSVHSWGIDTTIKQIILPFLERLTLFSYKGHKSCAYHFAVTAIRRKLILAIEQVKPEEHILKSALLFLPEGEHYDLLLLYLNYQLRNAGLNVLYLGTDISLPNLWEVIQLKWPQFVVMYTSSNSRENIKKMVNEWFIQQDNIAYFVSTEKPVVLPPDASKKVNFVIYKEVVNEVLARVK